MSDKNKENGAVTEFVDASDVFIRKSQLGEFGRYLLVGFSATFLTLILIWVFNSLIGIPYTVANILACFIMIFGAFPPYKLFVFRSRSWKLPVVVKEFVTFFSARAFTFVFDIAFIWLMVDILKFDKEYPISIIRQNDLGVQSWALNFTIPEEWVFKFISMVVTTVANYIFSKFVIFSKKDKE